MRLVQTRSGIRSPKLGPAPLRIGRAVGADWVIDDTSVSSRHVEVWIEGDLIRVRDLGSKNGTFVNGVRVLEALLGPADRLSVGTVALTVGADALGLPAPWDAVVHGLHGVDVALAERAAAEVAKLLGEVAALQWASDRVAAIFGGGASVTALQTLVDTVRAETTADTVWAITWSASGKDGRGPTLQGGLGPIRGLARAGAADSLPDPDALPNSIVGQVARAGVASWSDDALSDERYRGAESVQALSVRSVGCVPIGAHGALYLSHPGSGRFPADVRRRIEELCRVAAPLVAAPAPVAAPLVEVPGLVGVTPVMQELFRAIRTFAPIPWPVLILGETGTGKEGVASALHALSGRKGPFEPVNCAAIPGPLAESMLFGHKKGAFTGAVTDQDGVLDRVGEGTLFLDEVGELPAEVQAKLLRVLQEGTWQRVGEGRVRQFRGRIVAATHRPLDAGGRGGFRDDLYYRLAACVLRVPPLRDRPADVPHLTRHLLERATRELGGVRLTLSTDASRALQARDWPGNVRDLENAIKSAIPWAVAEGSAELTAAHLGGPGPSRGAATSSGARPWEIGPLLEATEAFQRHRVHRALEATRGNHSEAARVLGVTRQWLYRFLEKPAEPS